MNQRNAPRKMGLKHLALAAVLSMGLVGLSQCRSVTEPLTGVDLRTAGTLSVRSSCQRRCNTRFKAGLIAEEYRHQQAKRACHHDYQCKKNEDRDHARNVRDLIQAKKACKRSCYNEGSGSGV
jgi:hypothetical protein